VSNVCGQRERAATATSRRWFTGIAIESFPGHVLLGRWRHEHASLKKVEDKHHARFSTLRATEHIPLLIVLDTVTLDTLSCV
jgi:hypothetical protein